MNAAVSEDTDAWPQRCVRRITVAGRVGTGVQRRRVDATFGHDRFELGNNRVSDVRRARDGKVLQRMRGIARGPVLSFVR